MLAEPLKSLRKKGKKARKSKKARIRRLGSLVRHSLVTEKNVPPI